MEKFYSGDWYNVTKFSFASTGFVRTRVSTTTSILLIVMALPVVVSN